MINELFMRVKNLKNNIQVEGYKTTSLGIIPDNWNDVGIEECSKSIFLGLTSKVDYVEEGGYPLIRAKDISNGVISFKDVRYISDEQHRQLTKYRKAEKGDVLVSKSGTLGTCCLVNVDHEFSVYESIIVIKPDYSKLDGKYLLHLLRDSAVQERMLGAKVGGTVSHLNLKHFRDLKLPLPPYNEQTRIAETLSTWDKAIELKEQLIEEKKKQKSGLMQKLLTGKVRLPGFDEEVNCPKLENYIEEVKKKNKENNESRVLSVTNKQGFILQEDQFNRIVASKDLSNYKIVKKGEFAYNPSRVNVGSIDLLKNFESGLLSPMYVVFKCKEKLNNDYLYHFIKSEVFLNIIPNMLQGSVRDSLSFESLKLIKLFIPSLEEQKAIAKILNTADKEINLLEKELESLKLQKKGLMQLLLTGIVRVQC